LRKISKSVVAHYGVSPDVYQGWIETYLEKADNQRKLLAFREELRDEALKSRRPVELSKEGCLSYAEKLHQALVMPKAMLLM